MTLAERSDSSSQKPLPVPPLTARPNYNITGQWRQRPRRPGRRSITFQLQQELWADKLQYHEGKAERMSALRAFLAMDPGDTMYKAMQDFCLKGGAARALQAAPRRPCPPKHPPHQHREQLRAMKTLDYCLFMHDSWKP